jgi:hypothetical protein
MTIPLGYRIVGTLISPPFLLFDAILSLLKGELFPIKFKFGSTCGPVDHIPLGNGQEWLLIISFLLVLVWKIITKRPRSKILTLLIFYIAIILASLISQTLAGEPPSYCI